MPLPTPNLDDHTFADLIAEARSWIPTLDPGWTDHNVSDPGITLLELLAWLTEMLLFRLNRVTDDDLRTFLQLLDGELHTAQQNLGEDISKTIKSLRQTTRAVTLGDYESLAPAASTDIARVHCVPRRDLSTGTANQDCPGHVSVIVVPARLVNIFLYDGDFKNETDAALPDGRMTFPLNGDPNQFLYVGATVRFSGVRFSFSAPGTYGDLQWQYTDGTGWATLTHDQNKLSDGTGTWKNDGLLEWEPPTGWKPSAVNDILRYWVRVSTSSIPTQAAQAYGVVPRLQPPFAPFPCAELLDKVKQALEPARILTTRNHVVGPSYVTGQIEAGIIRHPDALDEVVKTAAENALYEFLDPWTGGPDGGGWPFGRSVYVSELYDVLERSRWPGLRRVDPALQAVLGRRTSPRSGQQSGRSDGVRAECS